MPVELGRQLWLLAALAGCTGRDIRLGDGRLEPTAPRSPVFSEPIAIAALAGEDASDDDPSLSADRTLLYFNSERPGGAGEEDIWFTQRARAQDDWAPPAPVAELNTEERETGIALAPDGLTIWFSSDRPGGAGGLDVYSALRSTRDAAWSAPAWVPELSGEGDDLVSSLGDEGRALYLARRDDDDQDYDLYVARRSAGSGAFEEPTALSPFNTEGEESDAFATLRGSELLFTRDEDLWLGPLAAQDAARPLDALNSDADDRDPWSSEAGDYLVFSSDRSGRYLLYESARCLDESCRKP